uniref:DNA-directed RNA polymerase subunit alpha n=1 Tax=Candidatus Karelsulcia muelleri TaxID=336810 RepID=UPI0032B23B34
MFFSSFTKNENLIILKLTPEEGAFKIEPLYPGWGLTIGNSLRRVLLSSLEGYAISSVKIEGVNNEYSTIKGVIEDMTDIILNLKKIRFKKKIEDEDFESEEFNIIINNNKKEITAGDLGEFINLFEIINPYLIILNKEKLISLNITLVIKRGIGYLPSEKNKEMPNIIGTIPIDTIFTPIKKVKYKIDNCSINKNPFYESLILKIKTDGSINPRKALTRASNLLIRHFQCLSNEKILLEYKKPKKRNKYDKNILKMRKLLKSSLEEEIDYLSVRTLNCLKSAKIFTWGDLVKSNKSDLLKLKNFGRKSLSELDKRMKKLNIYSGMDISIYKLNEN